MQVIDILGLMGDSSDNIPGCPGVGGKTASKLVNQFGSIENLLEHTDELKGSLKTKVETHRDTIAFSKFLATIKTDVPITLDLEALTTKEPDAEALQRLFEDLEFRTLLERTGLFPRLSLCRICGRIPGSKQIFKSQQVQKGGFRLPTH